MTLSDILWAVISSLDVETPRDLDDRISKILQNIGLSREEMPTPTDISLAWKRFLDADAAHGNKDSLEQITVLGGFLRLTESNDRRIWTAFSECGINLSRSRTEMSLRLASRLYMLGRKFKIGKNPDGPKLLSAAVRSFDDAAIAERWLRPNTLRRLFGMRGVAILLLNRANPDIEALKKSLQDLEKSNVIGDESIQNLEYRRECVLRIFEYTKESPILDKLEELLLEDSIRNRQFYSDKARFFQARASMAMERGQDASDYLVKGLEACTAGLSLPPEGDTPDEVFHNLRGFLLFISTQVHDGAALDDPVKILDRAIDDLRLASIANLGGASLSQALLRRASFRRQDSREGALIDLREAQERLPAAKGDLAERLGRQIRAAVLECEIRSLLDVNEYGALLEKCVSLVELGEEAGRHVFTVLLALGAVWKHLEGAPPPQLIQVSEGVLPTALTQVQHYSGTADHAGVILSYAAGISRRLDRKEVSRRTYDLFRMSVERHSSPNASVLTQAADVALQTGKAKLGFGDSEGAESFFQDAVEWFERGFKTAEADREKGSLPETFLPVVCHSKLGEAYLRLRRGRIGARVVASRAIEHFQHALDLGNDSPELMGLLGDAYYRRGYASGNRSDLKDALDFKLRAQAFGHATRENLSVVARIYYRCFELDGNVKDLANAIEAAFKAHVQSKGWVWPLFQLAEFARTDRPALDQAVALLPDTLKSLPSYELIEKGDVTALLEVAVSMAIADTEFGRDKLGGRSGVFTLADPHRLISTTLILKPTYERNASKEIRTIETFGAHLRNKRLHEFLLPQPISIIRSSQTDVTYAMERARGDSLGERILGADGKGYQGLTELKKALEFLGVFHQWAGIRLDGGRSTKAVAAKFYGYAMGLGLPEEEAETARSIFAEIMPEQLPISRKNDAHPENWIVDNKNRIVMIDLESDARELCLLDVAQLIDDYPALTADIDGWRERMALCEKYIQGIGISSLSANEIARAYGGLAIVRCAFGIAYCQRESGRKSASSALHCLAMRTDHYRALLAFLGDHSTDKRVRELAGILNAHTSLGQPEHSASLLPIIGEPGLVPI